MDAILQCVFWNAVVATVLAFLAAGSVMHQRPALTHALWTLVLLKLITPSLIHVPIPGYSGYRLANAANVGEMQQDSARSPAGRRESAAAGTITATSLSPHDTAPGQVTDTTLSHSHTTQEMRARWTWAIVWAECLGALAWFAWAGLRIRRFHKLVAQAEPAPEELTQQVERLALRIGLARCPQVFVWPGVASPMVWLLGRRAKLLLPQELVAQLGSEPLDSVVLHELAHLRRGDHWVRLLELLATGFFWWHPVVWWARRELERVEEQACDAWVVWVRPEAAPQYADTLLRTIDFLSQRRASLSPLVSGIGETTFLKRRLSMIVEGNVPRVVSTRGRLMITLLAAVLLPLAPAAAANAPSLEEIKAALKQRQQQIQSLYVETASETTSPYAKEELSRLPGDYHWFGSWVGQKTAYHYAAQGEKRYSLRLEEIYRYERGYNGKLVWIRDVPKPGETVHFTVAPERSADGRARHDRFVYPVNWLALVVGAAIAGPNLSAKEAWDNDLFYVWSWEDAHQTWNLAASDRIEEVDGAKCAVIGGTVETVFKTAKGEDQKHVRHIKGWFDLEHGMALRKWEEQSEEAELKRVVTSHLEQVKPGLWLPQQVEIQAIAANREEIPEQYRGKLLLSTKIDVTKCTLNELTDQFFEPKSHVQPGDRVHRARPDRRIEDISASDL